jgi:hypothetical protein
VNVNIPNAIYCTQNGYGELKFKHKSVHTPKFLKDLLAAGLLLGQQ